MRHLRCGMQYLQLQHADFWVAACIRDLVPQPGIEPSPPALGARSLTHWTTREVPVCLSYTAIVGCWKDFQPRIYLPRVIIVLDTLAASSHPTGNTSLVLPCKAPCVRPSLPVPRPPPLSRSNLTSGLFTHVRAHTHTRKLLPGFVVSRFSLKNQDTHSHQEDLSRSLLCMTRYFTHFNDNFRASLAQRKILSL